METRIVVGDGNPSWNCTVLPGERMPKDIRTWVDSKVDQEKKCLTSNYIRTYTDTVINYVGDLIEDGVITSDCVCVRFGEQDYFYDSCGMLKGWIYGVFDY